MTFFEGAGKNGALQVAFRRVLMSLGLQCWRKGLGLFS